MCVGSRVHSRACTEVSVSAMLYRSSHSSLTFRLCSERLSVIAAQAVLVYHAKQKWHKRVTNLQHSAEPQMTEQAMLRRLSCNACSLNLQHSAPLVEHLAQINCRSVESDSNENITEGTKSSINRLLSPRFLNAAK